jgi:hypothetical protein
VLDLAMSVATGAKFHGGREVGAPGPVLYVIGEGNDELFGERVKAWCDARGLPLPDDVRRSGAGALLFAEAWARHWPPDCGEVYAKD